MNDNRITEFIDEPDTIRNEAMDDGLLVTDNRTTKLRWELMELGVKWHVGLKGVTWVGDWCFVEYDNGKFAATCEPSLTIEQIVDIVKEMKQ